MFQNETVRAEFVLQMIEAGIEHGASLEELLRGSGTTLDELRRPDSAIPADQEFAIIRNLVASPAGRVPGIGVLAAENCHLTSYGLWGFAVMSSQTLREAIDLGVRYLELVNSFTHVTMLTTREGIELRYSIRPDIPTEIRPFVLERSIALVQTNHVDLLGPGTYATRVTFPFPAPAERTSVYHDWFGVEPIFDADHGSIVIGHEWLDKPLPFGNEKTAQLVAGRAREVIARNRERQGFAGQVRDAILTHISESPSQQRVAQLLHVSDRTLRLRLSSEGTTFRTLADEVRSQLANEYLQDQAMSVSEVAARLGFSEVSSFSHAFRRWTGRTPREHRELALSGRA